MAREFKMPQLGEQSDAGTVIRVLVSPGDRVEKDQAVLEVETDKATAEVPCPFAGVVEQVKVGEGDEVQSGQVVLTLEEGGGDEEGESAGEGEGGEKESAPEEPEGGAEAEERGEEKARAEEPEERPEPSEGPASAEPQAAPEREQKAAPPKAERPKPPPGPAPTKRAARQAALPASPTVRQLALDLGVDLADVVGTDPGGRIVEADVKARARELVRQASEATAREPELPDFSTWGEVERVPMNGVRRTTARNVARAWRLVPHVSQFDKADVTHVQEFRKSYGDKVGPDAKLTVTAILIKIAALALRRFPDFNASVDMERGELLHKRFVHVGVAVDTERGLLVPVVRDPDQKPIGQLAAELTDLAKRARAGKVSPDEMKGSTFSITNLGGLGTTNFTPIVTWPHVAVLGVGRAEQSAVVRDGTVVVRSILPLCVTYDHRAVDGADAARFLRWIAEALEHPMRAMLGD